MLSSVSISARFNSNNGAETFGQSLQCCLSLPIRCKCYFVYETMNQKVGVFLARMHVAWEDAGSSCTSNSEAPEQLPARAVAGRPVTGRGAVYRRSSKAASRWGGRFRAKLPSRDPAAYSQASLSLLGSVRFGLYFHVTQLQEGKKGRASRCGRCSGTVLRGVPARSRGTANLLRLPDQGLLRPGPALRWPAAGASPPPTAGNPPRLLLSRPLRGHRPAAAPAGERGRAGRRRAPPGPWRPRGAVARPSPSRPVPSRPVPLSRAGRRRGERGREPCLTGRE